MQTHYKETATFLYTNYFSCDTLKGVNTGFAKGEALRLLRPNSSRSTFNKKTYRFSNMLKRIGNTQNKVLKTVSLELSSAGETVYLKTKKIARTHENITFCNNLIRLCQTSRTYRQGNYTLKLTLIITSRRKVIKRYLNNS